MFERTRSLLNRLTGRRRDPAADRRAWDRFASDRETVVLTDPGHAAPLRARVQDVSRGGVRLLVSQPLEAGDMINVELPPRNGDPRATVLACVVHVAPAGDDVWSVGCSFATELNDGDLTALGAKRVRPPENDKRSWERISISGKALYQPAGDGAAPKPAAIHNISPTGVALRLPERLEPGTLLNLALSDHDGGATVPIVACAVYISEVAAGEWLAGCNFIRELDDEEFQKLT